MGAALDELVHCGASGAGSGSPWRACAAARRRRLAARMEGGWRLLPETQGKDSSSKRTSAVVTILPCARIQIR